MTLYRLEDTFVKVVLGWAVLAAILGTAPLTNNVLVEANR